MNRLLASLTMCASVLGCGSDEEISIPYRANLDKLTSPDPSLALPELEFAIETHEGNLLFIAWLISDIPEVRERSLEYYLRLETEFPDSFEVIIEEIASERDVRLAEIERVAIRLRKRRLAELQKSDSNGSDDPFAP